jgi:hypothetical protein
MSKWIIVTLWLMAFAMAQVGPKVPPPKQPGEPVSGLVSIEVLVWFKGQAAEGLQVSLWELGPGGRLLLPKLRPNMVRSNAAGKVRWEGLDNNVWVVRIQGRDGFVLAVPVLEGYVGERLEVGPYRVEVAVER